MKSAEIPLSKTHGIAANSLKKASSYKQLADDIRRLTRHVYPDVSDRNSLEAELQAYISAVTDLSVLTRLVEQNPHNLADLSLLPFARV